MVSVANSYLGCHLPCYAPTHMPDQPVPGVAPPGGQIGDPFPVLDEATRLKYFRNRKGVYSYNLMGLCDYRYSEHSV